MSHTHDIPELDRRGLRKFAFTMAAVIVVLFGLFLPWLIDRPWPRWPWILAAIFAVPGLVAPQSLRPIYRGWMRFGLALNRITTPIIMSIMFYLVITPTGLLRRVFGGDPMKRKLEHLRSGSYRVPSKASPPDRMERPF